MGTRQAIFNMFDKVYEHSVMCGGMVKSYQLKGFKCVDGKTFMERHSFKQVSKSNYNYIKFDWLFKNDSKLMVMFKTSQGLLYLVEFTNREMYKKNIDSLDTLI
ncbi:MAG: hypothetical protein ACM3O3_13020 [Syntrophothermus sp.]